MYRRFEYLLPLDQTLNSTQVIDLINIIFVYRYVWIHENIKILI